MTYSEIETRLMENKTGQGFVIGEYELKKIMFYETPLTGDCLYKACKALNLNEPYMVQTAEGSGEYEPYITADGMLYVLKEGVEIK